MKLIIIANGDIDDYEFAAAYACGANCTVCCDGGLRHAHIMGLTPDYIIGDFDSVDPGLLERYGKTSAEIIRYPTEKDYTDMELGIRFAIEKSPDEVIILGGGGSRFDHTLANVQCLTQFLARRINARIVYGKQEISLLDGGGTFHGRIGSELSLLPLTATVTEIYTEGLKYPLRNETLIFGQTRGVSNVLISDTARVTFGSGVLCVVREVGQGSCQINKNSL